MEPLEKNAFDKFPEEVQGDLRVHIHQNTLVTGFDPRRLEFYVSRGLDDKRLYVPFPLMAMRTTHRNWKTGNRPWVRAMVEQFPGLAQRSPHWALGILTVQVWDANRSRACAEGEAVGCEDDAQELGRGHGQLGD